MFSSVVQKEISDLAKEFSFEPSAILAIAAVESAGVPFWQVDGKNVPPMRFEGHYFHRYLQGLKLEKAVSAGLAHPRASSVRNPSSWSARYALLDRAIAIDEEAALMSCSWGLGQVMGSHYAALGFASPQAMVSTANTGVAGQVELMIRFIDHNGLRTYIDAQNWAGFARRYNGPGYRKNRYDVKMANAYARYTGKARRLNSRMAEIQRDLRVLGYNPGLVDGIAGKKTKTAILSFQAGNGLVADGLVGTITQEAIDAALTAHRDKKTANRRPPIAVGFGALAASLLIAAYDQVLSFFSWIGEVIL